MDATHSGHRCGGPRRRSWANRHGPVGAARQSSACGGAKRRRTTQALRDTGAEVVVRDLFDLDSMHRVIAGCDAMSGGRAQRTTVVVYSTGGEDMTATS